MNPGAYIQQEIISLSASLTIPERLEQVGIMHADIVKFALSTNSHLCDDHNTARMLIQPMYDPLT